MKTIKFLFVLLFAFAISYNANASDKNQGAKKTAESVMEFAGKMEKFDSDVLKHEILKLNKLERIRLAKMAIADVKLAQASGSDKAPVGLYVLAVILPPVAVGIHTNWGMPTLYNVLWCCVGGVPGIIHAFIVLSR